MGIFQELVAALLFSILISNQNIAGSEAVPRKAVPPSGLKYSPPTNYRRLVQICEYR